MPSFTAMGKCGQAGCDEPATHFFTQDGRIFLVEIPGLCEKHAAEFHELEREKAQA